MLLNGKGELIFAPTRIIFFKKKYNMNNLKKMGWLCLFLCFSLASCQNDDIVEPVNPDAYEIPVKEVFAPLSGTVINEAGQAVSGALVKVGNSTRLTDENGVFNFDNTTLNEYGSAVSISKVGYFANTKMVNAKAGKRSQIQVMLLAKTIVGTILSTTGGTLTANGNSKITLPANGIIDADGNPYTGEVTVAAKWLDPTASNLNEIMPGDLRAISTDQELVQLATYGMLGVELEGSAGEALNIAEGSVANLEFPVPATLRGGAPATIPLWSFDEATGYWEEEGQATFDGEKYVGDVTHFSFWNVDAKFPVIEMEGSLIDTDGNPLVGYQVSLEINSSALTSWGNTDNLGVFGGKIPKDEELTLRVYYNNVCSNAIHSQVIGPFSDDVVLPPITVDFTVGSGWNLNLSGLMEDCGMDVVTNGYLKVTYDGGGLTLFPDNVTGAISGSAYFCSNISSVDLIGFDQEGQKKGVLTSFAVVEGTDLDFGVLSICEVVTEFLEYNIDGTDFFLFDPSIRNFQDPNSIIYISGNGLDSSGVELQLLALPSPGTSNPQYASFTGTTNNTFLYAYCDGQTSCDDFEVEITEYGQVGEFAKGTFNGTMDGSGPGGTSTISGSFVILIE